jgi:hypothetical protein
MRTLREVIEGPFANWIGGGDWTPWLAFLAALRGEPMTAAERALYVQCTGRRDRPREPCNEAWVIVGRRGRKSAIAAVLGCYFAIYQDWPRAAGETVRVLIVAVSKDQAKIVRGYCEAILESRPGLKRLIKASDSDSITLTNGIQIVCVANSYRSIRGPTVVCAIFEEVAYWFDDRSANPDKEILRAVRPSMLTVPGALLLGISSPYAKRGLLHEKFKKHFGKDGSKVLIWKAPTTVMNPQVDRDVIAQAYSDDPQSAAAEYGAEFRSDIESYLSREAIESVIPTDVGERPPMRGVRYAAFVDPSGGSADSMTLAIAHRERSTAVLDAVRERRPPFSPEDVVAEFSALLKAYGIRKVVGDRYAGEWPRERFRVYGITYEPAAKPKSDLYRDLLPAINSRSVDLLDHERLLSQLVGLERRTARSGRDSIDHAPGSHDDIANAVAGVLTSFVKTKGSYDSSMQWVAGEDSDAEWRRARFSMFVNSGGTIR